MLSFEMNTERIAKNLRELRKTHGLSLKDAAKAYGVCVSAVQMYESGARIPRDDVKKRIAYVYKKSVSTIFFAD